MPSGSPPDGAGEDAASAAPEFARAEPSRADEPRYESYWEVSESGSRLVSRPIVVDGLSVPSARIELAPRIREVGNELVDNSYHAVEHAAVQFYRSLTLEQLVMATAALRIQMRKHRHHLGEKRALQERWSELARRMKRLRVQDEHLALDERLLAEERSRAAAVEAGSSLIPLLAIEFEELEGRRAALAAERVSAQAEWDELERLDEALMRDAPHLEQSEDLKYPYVLLLLPGSPDRRRSLASAMHALVEALQKPLSRTDQLLLEIALRRSIRALSPAAELAPEAWERALLKDAEQEFVAEFPWALRYVGT